MPEVIETSLSLLQRLANNADSQAWGEFCRLYEPLLRVWLDRYGIQACDADDLVQDTLLALVADIQRFQHPGHAGAFRGWIRSILVNRLRTYWRKRRNTPAVPGTSDFWARLDELEDPNSSLSHLWNTEHDRHVLGQLLERVAPQFAESTYGMFRRYVLENVNAPQVAAEWGGNRQCGIYRQVARAASAAAGNHSRARTAGSRSAAGLKGAAK
jgi:RNA polymerase sigma-70 factor (ECF subfamily)